MFLLSNEVMRELVTATHTPSQEDVTTALWSRFGEEADISIVWERGAWTIADAASSQILVAKGSSSIGDDLVDLVSARLISVSETEAGAAIAEANIKQMTGGDVLKGDRYMEAG